MMRYFRSIIDNMDMARDILVLLFIIASAAKTADAVSTTDASTTAEATTEAPSTTTYPPTNTTTTTTTEVATTTTTNASTTNNSSTDETTTSSAQVSTNTSTDSSSSSSTTTTTTTKTSTEETTSSSTNAETTNTTNDDSTPTITTVSVTTGGNNSQTSTIDSSSSTQSLPTSTSGATTGSTTTENSTTLLTTSTPHGNGTTLSITVASTASGAPNVSSSSTTNGSTSSTTSLTTVDTTTTDNVSSTSSSGTSSSKTTVPSGATSTPTPSSEFTSSQTTESSTTSTNTLTGTTTTVLSTVTSSESSSEPTTTPTTKATVVPTTASSSTAGTAKPGFSTVAPNKNAVFSLTLTVTIPNNQTITIDNVIKELENAFKNVAGFLRVEKDNSDSQTRRKRAANETGAQSQTNVNLIFDATNRNINATNVEEAIDKFNQSTHYTVTKMTLSEFARQVSDRCLIDDFCRNGFKCLYNGECYSKCASPDRECQNGGTCFVSVNETVTKTLCRCKTEEFYRYEGEHCENKVMKWELAVAIAAGSGGALVIILLFIIIILCAKRSSDSKYKHIKNSGGSSGAYANDAELNVYRPRQSTKYKESGLDQVDLQPGYDNKAYDFDSLPDSDSQGNSSFLHSSSNKRWDPDASSETYAKIYRQLEDTNYQVGIKRPQVSTRRNEVLTGF